MLPRYLKQTQSEDGGYEKEWVKEYLLILLYQHKDLTPKDTEVHHTNNVFSCFSKFIFLKFKPNKIIECNPVVN